MSGAEPLRLGNTNALSHGATSPRIVSPRTEAIVAEWMGPDGLPMLTPADRAAVFATASAYARLQELTAYLDAPDAAGNPRGIVDSKGRPRGCSRLFLQAYSATMGGLRQLGATPAGRADMATGMAAGVGLAAQLARHRKERP